MHAVVGGSDHERTVDSNQTVSHDTSAGVVGIYSPSPTTPANSEPFTEAAQIHSDALSSMSREIQRT